MPRFANLLGPTPLLALGWGVVASACSVAPDIAYDPSSTPEPPRTVVVLVTGFGNTPEDVREHGLFDRVREEVGELDAVIVYHDAPSFLRGEFDEELDRRVVDSPGFEDYQHHVLVGFSSGGTAALQYAIGHPDTFEEVVLYAPYLGPQYVVDEIGEAGGLQRWYPRGVRETPEDLWLWIKDYALGEVNRPSVHFLWGDHDDVAPGLAHIQGELPDDRVLVMPGDHGWATFDRLWNRFLTDRADVFRPRPRTRRAS